MVRPVNLSDRLVANRRQFDVETGGTWAHRYLSATEFVVDRALREELRRHSTGRFLDAGCGGMPYRAYIEPFVDEYVGLDVEQRHPDTAIIGDIQSMPMVDSDSFDTVLASEVLEHVPRPGAAFCELGRILRPGGHLIVTVPHLSRIHEAPHDYFRFTRFALRLLVEEAGLEVQSISEVGSIGSFLAHQASTAIVMPVWHVPIVKWLAFGLSTCFVTLPALAIDSFGPLRRMIPLDYVVVARKPAESPKVQIG